MLGHVWQILTEYEGTPRNGYSKEGANLKDQGWRSTRDHNPSDRE